MDLPPNQSLLSKDKSVHVTDERFNTVSHLCAAIFAIPGSAILIAKASVLGDAWLITGMSLYGLGLVSLFVLSTLHHSINASAKTEEVLRSLDYAAIFLLIAGTYSPFCLAVRDVSAWSVFGTVWALCIAGFVVRICWRAFPKCITMPIYLSLGWLALWMWVPLTSAHGIAIGLWLGLGGILYTLGGVVFTLEKPNPFPGRFGFHEIWHLFVMGGAAAHFIAVYMLMQ